MVGHLLIQRPLFAAQGPTSQEVVVHRHLVPGSVPASVLTQGPGLFLIQSTS